MAGVRGTRVRGARMMGLKRPRVKGRQGVRGEGALIMDLVWLMMSQVGDAFTARPNGLR